MNLDVLPEDGWPWVVGGIAVLIVLPILIEWMRRRPPGSPQRVMGWAGIMVVGVVTLVSILGLLGVGVLWLAVTLVLGEALASLVMGVGWAWLRAIRRGIAERQYSPENLLRGPADVWLRPRRGVEVPAGGLTARVDRWLSAEGPPPTAGWWHNGGLIVDARGVALVDAAGMRHELPATAVALIRLDVPRAVLLVDEDDALVAQLPTVGFGESDLRDFCAAAGWEYDTEYDFGHTARYALDLRPMVADHAARDVRPFLVRVFSRERVT